MRVLHVVTLHTPTHAFGGPTRVAFNLTRGLRERGTDARVLALADGFPSGPLPTTVEDVPSFLFRAQHLLPRFEVSGITSVSLLAAARGLVAAADVVHVHLMRDLVTLPVALMALHQGTPLVLQTHGMVDPTEKRLAQVVDAVGVRRAIGRADLLCYLTDPELRGLRAVMAPAPLPRHMRLVNGVPGQQRRPLPGGAPTVSYIARFQDRKHPEDFVRAVPGVLRERPATRFVMAGPDSGALDGTRRLASSLGVSDSIDFAGPMEHDQVLDLLRGSWAYVLPSVNEPFPMSVLEALSLGVPSIVTTTNGLADAVSRASAGGVVAPHDPAVLAAAIVGLLDNDANDAASRNAWSVAMDRFAMSAVLDALVAGYQQAIADHSTTGAGR